MLEEQRQDSLRWSRKVSYFIAIFGGVIMLAATGWLVWQAQQGTNPSMWRLGAIAGVVGIGVLGVGIRRFFI